MKKFLVFLLVLVNISCAVSLKGSDRVDKENGRIPNNQEQILKHYVETLSSDDLEGRDTGSAGIEKAAVFIENEFKKANIKPYFKTYRDSFIVNGVNAYNIVGYIEGQDKHLKDEFVVIGAHYDHIGFAKLVEGDSIANGANDNATGTSTVMALANYFSIQKNNKRSILVVLFTAEEKGLLGSEHLAEKLKNENMNLYTMVNFEMLGVPLINKDYEVFLTGYEKSNMASIINGYLKEKFVGFSEMSKRYSLFKRSDNYPFYKHFNLPCHTISSSDDNYDYYHHVDDEVNQINFRFMSDVFNKLKPLMELVCNAPTKEIKLNEQE